ncbi:hypothetical protein AAH678_06840 [Sodalis endosymbiont of Spalangia cameroni]|uniref:hypothetical protein n=1 Tax=Sodalis praecaptivus TaxID=1239307 RepID=UPI0031F85BF8
MPTNMHQGEGGQPSTRSRLEKISPDLFACFLSERGISELRCPICHCPDMNIPQVGLIVVGVESASIDSHPPVYVDYITINANGTPHDSVLNYQYRLICKNCGFTSHFAIHPVLDWFDKRNKNENNG